MHLKNCSKYCLTLDTFVHDEKIAIQALHIRYLRYSMCTLCFHTCKLTKLYINPQNFQYGVFKQCHIQRKLPEIQIIEYTIYSKKGECCK